VLIYADHEIVGQIDIDAREINAFPAEDQAAIELVAQKLGEMIERERRDLELERQLMAQQQEQQQPRQDEQPAEV
jgi:hypothetical protein